MSEPNSKTKMRDNARGLTAARAISAPISGSSAGCPHDPERRPGKPREDRGDQQQPERRNWKPRSRRRVTYAVDITSDRRAYDQRQRLRELHRRKFSAR